MVGEAVEQLYTTEPHQRTRRSSRQKTLHNRAMPTNRKAQTNRKNISPRTPTIYRNAYYISIAEFRQGFSHTNFRAGVLLLSTVCRLLPQIGGTIPPTT